MGEDFHFGHRRAGNVPMLRRLGAELGFEVDGIELVGAGNGRGGRDAPVSSTRIRRALVEGELALANTLLGRAYEVRGVVALGDKRGRELGFPTANVSVPGDILLPADGIYAGWFERPDGSVHASAISLGRRPTFYVEAHVSLLEAHLLDFDGDLYDEHVKVRFVARLRDEVRFDSVEALVEQIQRDVDQARELLPRLRLRRGLAYGVSGVQMRGKDDEPSSDDDLAAVIPLRGGSHRGFGTRSSAQRVPHQRPANSSPSPGSPATRSCLTTTTASVWPCAARGCRSFLSTGSPPRASCTRRRFRVWCAWDSRSSPSTWPVTAAPRAYPQGERSSSRTRGCWPGCWTSSVYGGPCSQAIRWAADWSRSWWRSSQTGRSAWCSSTRSWVTAGIG